METEYTAHIISHTHWDREWYLNSKYTNQWLVTFFENLFRMLEKEDDYIFVLDGQMAMIEDYFEELAKSGLGTFKYRKIIKKYVEEKRLFIGPYYLQPDWQLLSEESLVRNLMIGNSLAEELGGAMKVGWMMDNFGQISQTPQIHMDAGLYGLYVWRGVEMDPDDVKSEFLWKSPDGTEIPSVYLLDSYRNVMRLAEYEKLIKKRIYTEVDKLKPFTNSKNILLMNGYDQELVPDDIQPFIKGGKLDSDGLKVIQSNPEKYFNSLLEDDAFIKTLQGSLYSGRFIAVFPGVMSARIYLKQQNDQQQKLLEKLAEPLSALAWGLGGEYDGRILLESWKILLKNHPHDSICGVSIDDVHADMEERSRYVNQLSMSQVNSRLKELIGFIDTSGEPEEDVKVVFNPSFFKRKEVVDFDNETYLVELPSLGFKVINSSVNLNSDLKYDSRSAENSYVKLRINPDGTCNILHKKTGIEYKNLGNLEDRGDSGDEYNYSSPDYDTVFLSSEFESKISLFDEKEYRVVFKIATEMRLPESDTKNHSRRSSVLRIMPVIRYITLDSGSPVVKFRTLIRNTVKDHIVRVLFPTSIKTGFSYAGSPFDITQRPLAAEIYDDSTIPENVRKVIVGAREADPNTIFLNREFVDLNNKDYGFALLSRGLPEYQVVGEDNKIALTLFRSVGWVAKDINSRIGDAGPKIFTPGAQCLREMSFEYGVYIHEHDVYKGNVLRESDIFNSQVLKLETNRHKGIFKNGNTFFSIYDNRNSFKVTAFKRSENGKSLILRGYNSCTETIEVNVESFFKLEKVCVVDLLENEKEQLVLDMDKIRIPVAPKKIVSLKIDITRNSYGVSPAEMMILENDSMSEDFSSYAYSSAVTEENLSEEVQRADSMIDDLKNPLTARTALEAQLSAILTQNRINEIKTSELGYKLNEARVQRRVFDYIQDYDK